ncbi:fimbria/pilus outer membrane usher protein [Salmonella enterica subsp. enterica serovar Kentucky]|nr:fimbria/pilus outer membrane usher protein [Salmonella enterica subsp. enterica serovar Kentucky]
MTRTIGLTAIKAGRNGRIITIFIIPEGKVQLDINQQLGGLGSLFITGSQQSYWHTDEKDSLLQVGYSDTLAGIAWSVSYNNNKSAGDAERDQIFALNISVPLSQWLQHDDEVTRHHNVYATFSTSTDKQHNVTQNAGLSGTLLDENNLSYNIQQGYQNHGIGESGAASPNTMARKVTPILAITLAITAITSR